MADLGMLHVVDVDIEAELYGRHERPAWDLASWGALN